MFQWYHTSIITLHRPLISRPRIGQPFVSNVHHKKATEHANRLVDLLTQYAAGQEIDKVSTMFISRLFASMFLGFALDPAGLY